MGLFDRLRAFSRGRRRAVSDEDAAELSREFQRRYHHFRLLLAANNDALALMAEIEKALAGETFGMPFVRAKCTALSVAVYNMVRNLDALAPGRYEELFDRVSSIQEEIQGVLDASRVSGPTPPVLLLAHLDRMRSAKVGAKMATLGEIASRVGLRVPEGFVITSAAYAALLNHNELPAEIRRLLQLASPDDAEGIRDLSAKIQHLIRTATIPENLAEAITAAYHELEERAGGTVRIAVRSSILGEDLPGASSAGQYLTALNVRGEDLLETYLDVVASKYSPQAILYRLAFGMRDDETVMCVGCLAMVDAVAGGVIYTRSAIDEFDRAVHITSGIGLPAAVVDGSSPSDHFVVSREDPARIRQRQVARKTERLVNRPTGGVERQEIVGAEARAPSLSDEQVSHLARQALELEKYFGAPQDIEWALDRNGEVVILQSRVLQPARARTHVQEGDDLGEPIIRGGIPVSPGAASGPVYEVYRESDAADCPAGAVLVVDQPLPAWGTLLMRSSAVLARLGNQAGHLATVARELGVPAIFGLGDMVDCLANGQVVTVDAKDGAIYENRLDESIRETDVPKLSITGSRVHQALEQVRPLIAPLHLLDPDAPSFSAQHCATLHDVTRFCHEKAVREMFSFGKDHHFPRHSSKQLHHNVPMQWWVLDLDDGFQHEVKGRYVQLEEITSIPLHALWEGMVAVPWQGPPAGRGLLSVMFEATANPALATPFRKPYAERNYFMISKHFMNLQSRFGFHFSGVEALISDRRRENYVSFTLKGGAADRDRRDARARFVASILEEHGFLTRVDEDLASARLSGLAKHEMQQRMRLIGYLIMHTRQLDVIMSDPERVVYYASKMREDIASLGQR
ncbi:MAG: PEP/pyruvate-binding domain-containing protein [Planctomycetota bacterium]|jgi:pyruvate,water dikinase